MLRYLEQQKVVELSAGGARGDPEVSLPEQGTDEPEAFELLARVVAELEAKRTLPLMSGLKDRLRKRQPSFRLRRLSAVLQGGADPRRGAPGVERRS